ncbi:MAG: hypothetical protein KDA60_11265 [Planctomycetales bacterium]|nr:hypothetical protein [Planctomycetales bacterium]
MTRVLFCVVAYLSVSVASAWGQEDEGAPGQDKRGTLPSVEVRPPETSPTDNAEVRDEDLPYTDIPFQSIPAHSESQPPPVPNSGLAGDAPTSGPTAGNATPAQSLANSLANPSLASQRVGNTLLEGAGIDSILRGEQSLFETPSATTIVDRRRNIRHPDFAPADLTVHDQR